MNTGCGGRSYRPMRRRSTNRISNDPIPLHIQIYHHCRQHQYPRCQQAYAQRFKDYRITRSPHPQRNPQPPPSTSTELDWSWTLRARVLDNISQTLLPRHQIWYRRGVEIPVPQQLYGSCAPHIWFHLDLDHLDWIVQLSRDELYFETTQFWSILFQQTCPNKDITQATQVQRHLKSQWDTLDFLLSTILLYENTGR